MDLELWSLKVPCYSRMILVTIVIVLFSGLVDGYFLQEQVGRVAIDVGLVLSAVRSSDLLLDLDVKLQFPQVNEGGLDLHILVLTDR